MPNTNKVRITPLLGTNLRKAREAKLMTQLALAHAIGYKGSRAGSYISRAEAGIGTPRLSKLVEIAAVLGITIEKLVSGGGGK